jgi:hypothetical protein
MFDLSTHPPLSGRRLRGALRGLQAGVAGALTMIAFMTIVSLLQRNPWWAYPNVLATMFYGGRALEMGPGWPTIAGAAVQVFLAGIAGALFGTVFSEMTGGVRALLLGIIWGLGWFYITDWFYRTYARLIPVYAPEVPVLMAHVLMGLVIGAAGKVRGVSQTDPPIG